MVIKTNSDLKHAVIIGGMISIFLSGLFLFSKTHADNNGSNFLLPPFFIPNFNLKVQTQTQTSTGTSQLVTGDLNNHNVGNSCKDIGPYRAVRLFTQNSTNAIQTVNYWEFTLWGSLPTGTIQHTVTDWLQNPPTYDLSCMTNEPQVGWVTIP